MADIITKAKLQLRVGNGEKVPMATTKLLINHGKPNFTIQRSTSKVQQNGEVSPLSPLIETNNNNSSNGIKNSINHNHVNINTTNNNNNNNNTTNNNNIERSVKFTNGSDNVNGATTNNNNNNHNNNDDVIVKSNKFNGILKPTTTSITTRKTPLQRTIDVESGENEVARVVLRRTAARRTPEPSPSDNDDDSVPEFIRRQRRIQERLAKENVLDFENRRSGYFTQVLISPSSPSRKSFGETMSSPAIVPALEMPATPPPTPTSPNKRSEEMGDARRSSSNEYDESEERKEITNEKNHVNDDLKNQEENSPKKSDVAPAEANFLKEQDNQNDEKEAEEGKEDDRVENEHEETSGQTAEQLEEAEVAKAIEEVNKAVAGEDDAADEVTVSHTNEVQQTAVNAVQPTSSEENGNGTNVVVKSEQKLQQTPSDDALLINQPIVVGGEAPLVIKVTTNGAVVSNGNHHEHETNNNTTSFAGAAVDAELQALAQLKFDIKGENAESVVVTPVLRAE